MAISAELPAYVFHPWEGSCEPPKIGIFDIFSLIYTSVLNGSQTVCKPNAYICGQDCVPALHHPRMVCISFAANQNLSVFCANTKRTGCAECPFHAPGVLCSPQVRGKLINHALLTRHTRMAQHVSGALVYTKLCNVQNVSFASLWENRPLHR